MSLPILTSTDFTGIFAIPQNRFTGDEIDAYIDVNEPIWIKKILSDKALIDIKKSTIPDKWQTLIDGVTWENSDDDEKVLTGLKDWLKYIIYVEYMRDDFRRSISGRRSDDSENSESLSTNENAAYTEKIYNLAVIMYHDEILPYLNEFQTIVTDIDGSVDNGDGTYTIQTSSTFLMDSGDTVTIDNVNYTISNIVDDTSFDINPGVIGMTFSGDYTYHPYKELNKPILKTIFY